MPDFNETIRIKADGKTLGVYGAGLLGVLSKPPTGMVGLGEGVHVTPDLISFSGDGEVRLRIDGKGGNIWVGGKHADGDLVLFPKGASNLGGAGASTIHLSAQDSVVTLRANGKETVKIDGANGDIILSNGDCAEDFEIEGDAEVEPGSVLVIGEHGRLRMADEPYDRRVAGVVSGAGGLRPGVILGRLAGGSAVPIGLAGRVFCKVDARDNRVETGDLLTTSATPGHAMRAADPARAFGSVVGKALAPLPDGRSLLPILVGLA